MLKPVRQGLLSKLPLSYGHAQSPAIVNVSSNPEGQTWTPDQDCNTEVPEDDSCLESCFHRSYEPLPLFVAATIYTLISLAEGALFPLTKDQALVRTLPHMAPQSLMLMVAQVLLSECLHIYTYIYIYTYGKRNGHGFYIRTLVGQIM